jgi:SWI/SNF-related matrix-associated actin-dependent regulator of chromatin subfamily A3
LSQPCAIFDRPHSGIVSDRENTKLRREPSNAYDRNAIQVLNMGGEQVGHIPREVAGLLAAQMDSIGADLRVEGFIPRGSGNVYSIPVQLSLYGPVAARAGMTQTMQNLQRRGERVSVHNPMEEAPPPPGTKRLNKSKLAPTASEIVERQLEDLYATSNKYEDMPSSEPSPLVTTELFLHQKKALWWMMDCEARGTVQQELMKVPADQREKTAVFFWQQKGALYQNVLTQQTVRAPPQLPRGGILADDMGLGKTLTTFSLIAGDVGGPPTLIVCPLSVITNWEEQAKTHLDPQITVLTYHGPQRDDAISVLSSAKVVITTYATLSSDFTDARKTGLHALRWRRVILDEGHYVKNRNTGQAKAAFALKASPGR